jgi:hypothetical protein
MLIIGYMQEHNQTSQMNRLASDCFKLLYLQDFPTMIDNYPQGMHYLMQAEERYKYRPLEYQRRRVKFRVYKLFPEIRMYTMWGRHMDV